MGKQKFLPTSQFVLIFPFSFPAMFPSTFFFAEPMCCNHEHVLKFSNEVEFNLCRVNFPSSLFSDNWGGGVPFDFATYSFHTLHLAWIWRDRKAPRNSVPQIQIQTLPACPALTTLGGTAFHKHFPTMQFLGACLLRLEAPTKNKNAIAPSPFPNWLPLANVQRG